MYIRIKFYSIDANVCLRVSKPMRSYITASNTHSIFAVLSSNGQQFETATPPMRVLACETSIKFRHLNVN